MTNEQKRELLSQAAFIVIDDEWFRMDLCTDDEFYYSDENSGEEYCETYDDIDIDIDNIELYKLQKIEIKEQA